MLVSERVSLLLSKAFLHVFSFNPYYNHKSIFTDQKMEAPVNDEEGIEIQVSLIPQVWGQVGKYRKQ